MTFTLVLLAIALLAIALAYSRLGMGRLNPVTVYALVWSLACILYLLPVLDLRPLVPGTARMLVSCSLAFVAGAACLTFCLRSSNSGVPDQIRRPGLARSLPHYDHPRLRRAYRWAFAALVAYVVIQLWSMLPVIQQFGGLSGILSGSGLAWRRANLELAVEAAQTNFTSSALAVALLGYLLFLGSMSIYWAGYFARVGSWGYALLPLLVESVYSLILLQRATFIYGLLLFAFSWYYHRGAQAPSTARSTKRGMGLTLALLLTPIIVIVPLQLRDPGITTGQQAGNVLTYFESGLAGINALESDDAGLRAAQPDDYAGNTTGGHGVWTFYGAASIAARLGLPIDLPSTFFNYVMIQNSQGGLSNTYTFMLYFYYDGGWVGLVLLSFGLGLASSWAHARARSYRDWRFIPIACLLMTTVAMSFFGVTMLRDIRYLFVAAAGFLIQQHVCIIRQTASDSSGFSESLKGLNGRQGSEGGPRPSVRSRQV